MVGCCHFDIEAKSFLITKGKSLCGWRYFGQACGAGVLTGEVWKGHKVVSSAVVVSAVVAGARGPHR